MAAPDLSTREKAFAHLATIIKEFEAERANARKRPELEIRLRRLEIALTLTYAEMIARTQPELVEIAEQRVADPTIPAPEPEPKPRPDAPKPSPKAPKPTRDFVGELETMAGKEARPGPPAAPRR